MEQPPTFDSPSRHDSLQSDMHIQEGTQRFHLQMDKIVLTCFRDHTTPSHRSHSDASSSQSGPGCERPLSIYQSNPLVPYPPISFYIVPSAGVPRLLPTHESAGRNDRPMLVDQRLFPQCSIDYDSNSNCLFKYTPHQWTVVQRHDSNLACRTVGSERIHGIRISGDWTDRI